MKDKIKKTLDHLKDFQRKTADYVVYQFDSGRNRMLIADEVGLGKTIVAKGIIARLFEKSILYEKNKQFSVVYVCSNQAIAKANIGKLNF
jgi:superfamily II DNA or RNA helicase